MIQDNKTETKSTEMIITPKIKTPGQSVIIIAITKCFENDPFIYINKSERVFEWKFEAEMQPFKTMMHYATLI